MRTKAGVLILAGGKSERMDFPKSFLQTSGKSFLENIVGGYFNNDLKNIYVVLNKDLCEERWSNYLSLVRNKVTIIPNSNPDRGRIHSVKLGTRSLTDVDFCFIHNIDNPYVSKDVINTLWKKRDSSSWVSPSYENKNGHPVLISSSIIRHINKLDNGDYTLRDILSVFPRRRVPVTDENVLLNINTLADYANLLRQKFCGECV